MNTYISNLHTELVNTISAYVSNDIATVYDHIPHNPSFPYITFSKFNTQKLLSNITTSEDGEIEKLNISLDIITASRDFIALDTIVEKVREYTINHEFSNLEDINILSLRYEDITLKSRNKEDGFIATMNIVARIQK